MFHWPGAMYFLHQLISDQQSMTYFGVCKQRSIVLLSHYPSRWNNLNNWTVTTEMNSSIYKHIYIYILTYMHNHAYMQVHIHKCTTGCTNIHNHMHIFFCTHTRTYTHVYMQNLSWFTPLLTGFSVTKVKRERQLHEHLLLIIQKK